MNDPRMTADDITEALDEYTTSFDIDDDKLYELFNDCDDLEEMFDRLMDM